MTILAIESSCDETAIAILKDGKIIKNIIASQINIHSQYGGVIPEVAARLHTENFPKVLDRVLKTIDLQKITHVGYTAKPGLIGCLQIGKLVADAIGMFLEVPIVPINHLEAHVYGAAIDSPITYPALALLVSGGHTQLIALNQPEEFVILGQTQDDAVGEVIDKVARKLGLVYPGGPIIQQWAEQGSPTAFSFPFPKNDQTVDFSFSGLKSAVVNQINNLNQKNQEVPVSDIAASFQSTFINILISKTKLALKEANYKTLILAGGVSANKPLRSAFKKLHSNTLIPNFEYTTDNGAMVAKATEIKLLSAK